MLPALSLSLSRSGLTVRSRPVDVALLLSLMFKKCQQKQGGKLPKHLEPGVPGITLKGRPDMVSMGSPAGAGKKPLLRARAGQTLDDWPENSKTSQTRGGLGNRSSMHII